MGYQSPNTQISVESKDMALVQQREDFEMAGIHSGYRGVRLLGYANATNVNKFRRGEKLMTGVYVLRLSRLIQWKLLGFELDVIDSIDWINREVQWRRGKSAAEHDAVKEKISLIIKRELPLDPFQIDRERTRRESYRANGADFAEPERSSPVGRVLKAIGINP